MTPEQLRDAVIAYLEAHEATCAAPACSERTNLLAFLSHCAGLRSDRLSEFGELLAGYEARCEDCQHLRN